MEKLIVFGFGLISSCLMPSCLATNPVWEKGSSIVCDLVTQGLPGAEKIDYCDGVFDLDLTQ